MQESALAVSGICNNNISVFHGNKDISLQFMMIHSIFFDIDGTLVSFRTHAVPPSAAHSIKECQARGIRVFLCTGRPKILVQDFSLPQFGNLHFDGLIAQNGCYCATGDGQVIYQSIIDPRDIRALVRYLNDHEPFPVSLMTSDKVYINYIDQRVENLAAFLGVGLPEVRPLETVRGDVMQVNIYGDNYLESKVMREVFTRCESSRWHPDFADVTPQGNSKKTGIEKILQHYGLERKGTMAFGDGGNDISMLEYVEIGVAMGNADDPHVLEAVSHIAPPLDEDGIARFLNSFFLHL